MIPPATATRQWWLMFAGYPKNQNKRGHWATLARETKKWRLAGWFRAKEMQVPPMQRIRVSAVIVRRSIGVADEGNDRDRLKPIVDGLVDAGVVPNDTYAHVTYGTMAQRRGPAGLELLIEELDDE